MTTTPATSSLQDSFGFLLADISRLARRAFVQHLQGSALTPAQAKVLIHVERSAGIRQVDLADLLDIQPITLARLIDQLSQARMVERRTDPQDRRAYQIYLLPDAKPALEAIARVGAEVRTKALQGVSAAQAAAAATVLHIVRDNLSQR